MRKVYLYVCFILVQVLSAVPVLTEAASTDGRPETNTSCQGHKTHGHPAAMDTAARRNSGQ